MTGLHPDVETLVLEPSGGRVETGRDCLARRADPDFPVPNAQIGLLDEAFVVGDGDVCAVEFLQHVEEESAAHGRLFAVEGVEHFLTGAAVREICRVAPSSRSVTSPSTEATSPAPSNRTS